MAASLNSYVGGFSKAFLKGVDTATIVETFSRGVVIPEIVFVAFQMTFAAITTALVIGGFAERMKFSAVCAFVGVVADHCLLPDGPHGVVVARSGIRLDQSGRCDGCRRGHDLGLRRA